jgi:RNA-splicing ligase RtcB
MDLKIFTQDIEQEAKNQIYTLLALEPFKDCKVRIMPDVHAGAGCVIGFTANLGNKVIPNVVGVDIGCGMLLAKLGKTDIDFAQFDDFIKDKIPAGFNVHDQYPDFGITSGIISKLRCLSRLSNVDRFHKSLGTLGGGNHFIEVDVDDEGFEYLIIHTGSRNLGLQVAEYYQKLAITRCTTASKEEREQLIQELKKQGRQAEISGALKALTEKYGMQTKIPDELCYLDGSDYDDYLHDMRLCQLFAIENREAIQRKITGYLKMSFEDLTSAYDKFQTIHNYIDDDNIIRKGAIAAHKDELLIIPMNMRDGCIIGKGKGNVDWNESAPHGAGRLMSRAEARRQLQVEEFQAAMQGIYTTTANADTIDEAPQAYKPMDEIIGNIGDTVDIIKIIKPIYNFKAAELKG